MKNVFSAVAAARVSRSPLLEMKESQFVWQNRQLNGQERHVETGFEGHVAVRGGQGIVLWLCLGHMTDNQAVLVQVLNSAHCPHPAISQGKMSDF